MRTKTFPVRSWKTMRVRRQKRRIEEDLAVEHRGLAVLAAPEADEFPKVLEIVAPGEPGAHGSDDTEPVAFRRLDGRLHRAMRMHTVERMERWRRRLPFDRLLGMGKTDRLFPEERIAEGFDRAIPDALWSNPFGPFPGSVAELPGADTQLDGIRDVIDDGAERADRRIAKAASRLVVFDGLLWERVAEPVWTVDMRHVRMSPDLLETAPESFRLDRLEEAVAFARDMHGGPVTVGGKVLHLDATRLRRDDREMAAAGLAFRLSVVSVSPYAQLLPIEAVEALLDLRAAFAGMDVRPSGWADRLVELAALYHEALCSMGLNSFGAAEFDLDVTGPMRTAIERWTRLGGRFGPAPMDARDEETLASLGP